MKPNIIVCRGSKTNKGKTEAALLYAGAEGKTT